MCFFFGGKVTKKQGKRTQNHEHANPYGGAETASEIRMWERERGGLRTQSGGHSFLEAKEATRSAALLASLLVQDQLIEENEAAREQIWLSKGTVDHSTANCRMHVFWFSQFNSCMCSISLASVGKPTLWRNGVIDQYISYLWIQYLPLLYDKVVN